MKCIIPSALALVLIASAASSAPLALSEGKVLGLVHEHAARQGIQPSVALVDLVLGGLQRDAEFTAKAFETEAQKRRADATRLNAIFDDLRKELARREIARRAKESAAARKQEHPEIGDTAQKPGAEK